MSDSGPPLAPSNGSPHDPAMKARVSVLENDVKDIKADLRLIVTLFGAAFALLKLALR
jgi:hypothetical protein